MRQPAPTHNVSAASRPFGRPVAPESGATAGLGGRLLAGGAGAVGATQLQPAG